MAIDSKNLVKLLQDKKYKIRSASNTKIVLEVSGGRIASLENLAKLLGNLGAVYDPNASGSSTGGVRVDKIVIYVKPTSRSNGLDVEARAIGLLDTAIKNASLSSGGSIVLLVKGKKIPGITCCVKTQGTPKSDFHLVNNRGDIVLHISHKKGSTAKDFQQWGGVTEKRISENSEIKQFAVEAKAKYGDKMPNGESAFKKIKKDDLKRMSVYGVKYDSSSVDPNRVDVLIQGDPGLKKNSDGTFSLTASGHVIYRPDIPTGAEDPALSIIYKGDRDQLGIKGARVTISPIGGRTYKTQL